MLSLFKKGQAVELRKRHSVNASGGIFDLFAGTIGEVVLVVDSSYHVRFQITHFFSLTLCVPEIDLAMSNIKGMQPIVDDFDDARR
jgi:ribosomal protein L21E